MLSACTAYSVCGYLVLNVRVEDKRSGPAAPRRLSHAAASHRHSNWIPLPLSPVPASPSLPLLVLLLTLILKRVSVCSLSSIVSG
ncbi:hypothetical protein E2C01_056869 [Portunus trituberculatus]|uniref:Uncharacterized protein n=1 Tax=Portunus trituberculatus TaxID=210409 RepID=A0A5B7GYW1_PORTR|nr:hypothetical protein [Portunus trituberculatus]